MSYYEIYLHVMSWNTSKQLAIMKDTTVGNSFVGDGLAHALYKGLRITLETCTMVDRGKTEMPELIR